MNGRMKWLNWAWISAVVLIGATAWAGSLDSPAAPTDPGSAMYTLEDLYNRLDAGTAGTQSVFAEPSAGPGSTGHTLNQVMTKAPATNANAAVAGDVLSGKTYWGLNAAAWGATSGSMANRGAVTVTPGTTQQAILQGYHNGTGYVEGDADLVTGNIKAGINIFGVAGKTEVVDTTSGDAVASDLLTGKKAWVDGSELTGSGKPAPVPKTGQTTVYRTGDDATYQKGVASPSPRFTDNGDGTVTDNLTGLMWTKNANIWGAVVWNTAVDNCEGYSLAGYSDWRLPNLRELQSLIDYARYNPALASGHPFTGVQLAYYWSATTPAGSTTGAWYVGLYDGNVYGNVKTYTTYVWPVRGGQ
jgi:hypothetical protein